MLQGHFPINLDVNQGKKMGNQLFSLSIDFHKVSVVAPCAFIQQHIKK
jgi:hypothetical protein